jgi:hypothetical protein
MTPVNQAGRETADREVRGTKSAHDFGRRRTAKCGWNDGPDPLPTPAATGTEKTS